VLDDDLQKDINGELKYKKVNRTTIAPEEYDKL
jgi:hypothetical protein